MEECLAAAEATAGVVGFKAALAAAEKSLVYMFFTEDEMLNKDRYRYRYRYIDIGI